jgi:copper homeostasis protein (lipoprotein)
MSLQPRAGHIVLSVALVLMSGILPAVETPPASTPEARYVGNEPRTFGGVIPCADCEGIRMTLDLFPDRIFLLRQEYLGKNRAFVDLGSWSLAEDGTMTLTGGGDQPWLFRTVDEETLRKLDAQGEEIVTALNFDLKREPAFRLIEDPVHLSGLFVYMADAGRLTPCLTGRDLPVVQAGDNAALEKEYSLKKKTPGKPLLVEVTGHFAEAPKAEGDGKELSFLVEKLEGAFPDEKCPVRLPAGMTATKTPAGRTWTLATLHGQPVKGGVGRMAFRLKLETGGHHLSGSTGCNRLNGRYSLQGDGLTLSELTTTRMSCPGGAAEKEQAYLQMLRDVTGWRLSGDRLILYGRKEEIASFAEKEDD